MPRNQGTSRKGKPKKLERAAGMGRALQKAQGQRYRPKSNGKARGEGGMQMQPGVKSIGIEEDVNRTMSVLEVQDIDDFLQQADMANREFSSEKEGLVVLDSSGQQYRPPTVQWADQKTDFVFKELSVPRRPKWNADMSKEELDANEKESFLDWRRAIAQREEQIIRSESSASVTPFEKNLEVWRQLWRVLERSSCLVQLVDARNPLFYLSSDLKSYAEELGKPMIVLVNKSDYLTSKQRQEWADYLLEEGWDPVFFSAVMEQKKIDRQAQLKRKQEFEEELEPDLIRDDADDESDLEEEEQKESEDGRGIDVPLSRIQLMDYMLDFAKIHECEPDPRFENRIQFGMVGFPNVGKSSVINVLVGSSKHAHGVVRVAVASQPGKTKHFQTLLLPDSDQMMLCDCPGLVFPSFVSNTADLIAAGVYPIAQMRDHWPVVNLITERIPREILNATYSIDIPLKTAYQLQSLGLSDQPAPTGEEFLKTLCIARGMLSAGSGAPDYTRSSRMVIKDYASGRLLFCHPPPLADRDEYFRETIANTLLKYEKVRERFEKEEILEEQKESAAIENETLLIDNDILALVEDAEDDEDGKDPNGSGKKRHKKPKKQGRKARHDDPYGCHTDPEERFDGVASAGVVVKAGKYSRAGYTRPTSYGQARSAIQ